MKTAITREIEKFTPTEGANIVAIDSYELPGERLTLVEHCPSRAVAEARLLELQKEHPTAELAVYGPLDLSAAPPCER